MTAAPEFRIRRTFLLPLGLLLALCLALLVVCIVQGQPTGKIAILAVIILPVAILFLESAFRRVRVDDQEIAMIKPLRRSVMPFNEVTAVDVVAVRKRAFLTLSSEDSFLIISNAYADFPRLMAEVLSRSPETSISDETRELAKAPPSKCSDIVSCWLGVALVALILYIQLGGISRP